MLFHVLQFEETLSLVKLMESTGISAIGIHGRTKDERPKHQNHDDVIKKLAEAVSIPVIAKYVSVLVIKYKNTGFTV